MARLRSPSYPSLGLSEAIDLVRKIHAVERTYPVDRAVAAQHLGFTGITGHSAKIMASLIQYGLLEKAAKNEVRVSRIAESILLPDNPEEKMEAIRSAAFRPTLFSELRERFPQGKPSEGNLRTYLVKQGFSDRAVTPAISAYLRTCDFLQQTDASEGHRAVSSEVVESPEAQQVRGYAKMHGNLSSAEMASECLFGQQPQPNLNAINAQILGKRVRLDIMLDAKGLDKLREKIDALKTLIEDDWPTEQNGGHATTLDRSDE